MTTTEMTTTTNQAEGEAEDRGFSLAILKGSIAGIIAFGLLIGAAVYLVASSMDQDLGTGAIIGIAVWTGIWGGLFLGGTVAVGRWSMTRGH